VRQQSDRSSVYLLNFDMIGPPHDLISPSEQSDKAATVNNRHDSQLRCLRERERDHLQTGVPRASGRTQITESSNRVTAVSWRLRISMQAKETLTQNT
jgi:hypothetical protein